MIFHSFLYVYQRVIWIMAPNLGMNPLVSDTPKYHIKIYQVGCYTSRQTSPHNKKTQILHNISHGHIPEISTIPIIYYVYYNIYYNIYISMISDIHDIKWYPLNYWGQKPSPKNRIHMIHGFPSPFRLLFSIFQLTVWIAQSSHVGPWLHG